MKAPDIWAMPTPQTQKLYLDACSCEVYHWLHINIRQGVTGDSKSPANMRVTKRSDN